MILIDLFYNFVYYLAQVLTFAIFFRAILSWFQLGPENPLIVILYQVTEPVLSPLRRIVPRMGMLDLTPMIAILLLQLIAGMAAAY